MLEMKINGFICFDSEMKFELGFIKNKCELNDVMLDYGAYMMT